jgi:hypothetical protein
MLKLPLGRASAHAVIVALLVAACVPAADAPIPPGYEAQVPSARASLVDNAEGLIAPRLAFVAARCFANGGLVLVFREAGSTDPRDVAFAMQGAGAIADAWSGGFGQEGMEEEVAFNFGGIDEVPCPRRASG